MPSLANIVKHPREPLSLSKRMKDHLHSMQGSMVIYRVDLFKGCSDCVVLHIAKIDLT